MEPDDTTIFPLTKNIPEGGRQVLQKQEQYKSNGQGGGNNDDLCAISELPGRQHRIRVPLVYPPVPYRIFCRFGDVLSFGIPRASPIAVPSIHPLNLSSINLLFQRPTDKGLIPILLEIFRFFFINFF
jgi:hypothetical protein